MNCRGFGKSLKKKPSLYVNENGFISIYALMIVSVFLMFSSFMVQRIYTYASIRSNDKESSLLDVFIVNASKQYIENEKKVEQNEHEENKERDINNVEDEEVDIKTDSWNRTYNSIDFHFERKDFMIEVTYVYEMKLMCVQIQFDQETREIMNFAYVS